MVRENQFPTEYGCTPMSGFGMSEDNVCSVGQNADGSLITIDCAKAAICASPACACDANGCTSGAGPEISLDSALDDDGEHLVGTIVLSSSETRTIRLAR